MAAARGEDALSQNFSEFASLAKDVVKEEVEALLTGKVFSGDEIPAWTSSIAESCIRRLLDLRKSYKYLVNCSILQKNGAGFNSSSACFWNAATDGSCSVRWENDTMHCIIALYAVAA